MLKKTFYTVNAFRFLAEIFTFFIFIIYGLKFAFPLNILLGIILPLLTLVIWGTFVAPNARIKLSLFLKFLIEFSIFLIAFLMFNHFSRSSLPMLFLLYALATSILSKITDKIMDKSL